MFVPRLKVDWHGKSKSMGLVTPESFDDREVAIIYIVGRMSEGKRVEQVLSAHAIDYAVDAEPFHGRVLGLIPVEYEGIGFYVLAAQAEICRGLLREAGLVQGLVGAEDD
jgi:hypothetical protein